MASQSSAAALSNISEQTEDDKCQEHNLDQLECSPSPPGPEHKVDPQAVLNRLIIRKQPSQQHLKAREQTIFSGWYTQSPSEPEWAHGVPEPQSSTVPPRPPVKKHVQLKEPGHIKDSNQMTFSAMHGQSAAAQEKKKSSKDSSQFEDQPAFASSEPLTEDTQNKSEPVCITTLASQKLWKLFSLWRTNVYKKKRHSIKMFLQNSLFVLEPRLRTTLIEIRNMSCQITEAGTYQVVTDHTYTLNEFYDAQLKQQDQALSVLEPFRDAVKNMTVCAARDYLQEHQTTSADNFNSEKLNAAFFKRVTCFIRVVDHLMFSTVHSLVLNAVDVLLTVFQNQVERPYQITPQTPTEAGSEDDAEKKVLAELPLFMTELLLESNVLVYKPSEETFQETIKELIMEFKREGMSMKSLTADPEMDSLLEFKKHLKDNLDGEPCLNVVLEEDVNLQGIIQNVTESLHLAFDSAKEYAQTFKHYLAFSKTNENLALDAVGQQEPDLEFFAKTLELYQNKHKEALAIQEKIQLGLLFVDQILLRQDLVSYILSFLEDSHGMLLQKAWTQVDVLLAIVGDTKTKLECYPSTTDEMAEQLIFLNKIEDGILDIQEQHDNISKVYDLFKAYSVTIPSKDLVEFATLQTTINLLNDLIDDAVAERDVSMERFISSLAKDQNKLQEEVMKIVLVLQNPDFFDPNANSSKVRPLIEKIQITVDKLEALALSCNSYTTTFQLQNTRFDLLEETTAQFRLIQLLWNSMEGWDCLQNEWQEPTEATGPEAVELAD
ncbi:dynein axonemal heavy chain 6-like isoform 2-T2 [Anableps anableps]